MTGILNPEVLIVDRESRGKSQIEVATAAGTNQGHISKAENGILELPDEMLERRSFLAIAHRIVLRARARPRRGQRMYLSPQAQDVACINPETTRR